MPQNNDEDPGQKPRLRHQIECPRCHNETGKPDEEVSSHARGDLVEGLVGVTTVQCTNCFHEFEVVTHKQILLSMRNWIAYTPEGQQHGR